MKILHFLRPYHGKCDCCKRLTRIQDKATFFDGDAIVGEIALCPVCLGHFKKLEHTEVKVDPLAGAEGLEEESADDDFPLEEIENNVYDQMIAGASHVERLF